MEMHRKFGLAVFVIAFMLYAKHPAQCSFIIPEPQISNLSQWASIQVDQNCGDNCYGDFDNVSCIQTRICQPHDICNGRTGLPSVEYPLSQWSLESNSDGCRVTNNGASASPPTVFATDPDSRTLIVNGTAEGLSPCYSHRNGSIDDVFTLVFWLMADCGNCSVLDLLQNGKQSIHIRVLKQQVCVNTECQSLANMANRWVMISVRAVKNQLTIFLNDAPFKSANNALSNVDIKDIYIGSEEIAAIGDIFRLHLVRYYRNALTTRELKTLRTGIEDLTINNGDCQCPLDYLEDAGDNNCTNGVSNYPRYNTTVVYNDASVTVDGDSSTYWASSDKGKVVLMLNFSLPFQIESVMVTFGSTVPYRAYYSLLSGEQLKNSGFFKCTESTCRSNMTTLDNTSTVTDLTARVANKIQIELHRETPLEIRNFVITAIVVTGRCDCSGNADSCAVNYENRTYTCSCKQETHTQGQHCQSCTPNFFHSSDQFDCPNSCQCHADGVGNTSSQCEEVGGRCICKKNVEGQMCDMCKPFSFNFGGSPSDGCQDCVCYQNGSLSCSTGSGVCSCKANTQPPACDKCMLHNYGFNSSEGCQPCNCSEAGTVGQNLDCDESTGQCRCKSNVQGPKCHTCKPGFYDMEIANQQGCKPCGCHPVGSEANACDAVTGQCQCRGGIITNKSCTPEITSVDPTYGPLVGGTPVTIFGKLLGNTTHSLAIFLSDAPQDLILVSDMMVVFRTSSYNISSQLAPQLKLSWKEDSSPFYTQTTFSYRQDPVLDTSKAHNISTFVSGGCQMRIYGTDLQSVKYPKLEVSDLSNPMNRTVVNCRHTKDYVICPTPDLKGLYTSAKDQFQVTAIFDGVNSTDIGNIDVKPDPHFDDVGTIRFQYPFEDTIVLTGTGLRAGCPENEFTVLIGVINCAIVHITDTEIECAPAVSPPGGYKHLPIKVIVGNIQSTVGSLQYLELHETTGFIIIISCVAALIAIVIAVIIFCCCWHHRRHKTASPLISSEDKQIVAEEANTLNAYTELPEHIEEPATLSNGHIGTIHKETVFREPKKGIVNTEAEDSTLRDEFLPKVDAGLREDIRQCYIGAGHFVPGRHCALKGKQAQLIDGSLQKSGSHAVKLTIKSAIHPITESQLPAWGNLALIECLRLRRCQHKHVLSILGIGISKDQQFHILYPRMSQYILKTWVSDASKEFSVRQLLSFGQQVAEGITYLASKDITHKDVAARNCMVDEHSVVKLSDAAFSWDFFENEYVYDEQRERYLPIRWMAPESIKDGYYDMRTDVWAFAVLVWELLTRGCLPYHEATSSQEVSNFVTEGYVLGKPDILSENVYDLLCSCWSFENEHRPSIVAVSKSLGDILETEDDGTYANAGEVAAQLMKNTSASAMQLRQSPGGRSNTLSTSRLSQV